jgi:N-acetylglucosaminyldiphosphoundecaprenol N-acetyl-beta-D-mannosaminyltransferase
MSVHRLQPHAHRDERPSLAGARPETVDVLGVPLALTDYERTMDWIDAMVAERRAASVSPATVHLVMRTHEEMHTRDSVLDCSLVVPDGQPLVWAMHALGHDAERVYGPDLMARYSPPYRELSEEEENDVAVEINRSRADVVWVGVGQPKQEQWMARMRERLDAPVLVGVGAAFDFHAGLIPQAPDSMQRLGLEWAFRLALEPRRLWRRYLRYNPRFIAAFVRQYARERLARAVLP